MQFPTFRNLTFLIALLTLISGTKNVNAQSIWERTNADKTPGYVLLVKLTNDDIRTLRSTGVLKSVVPEKLIAKVHAVRLIQSDTKTKPIFIEAKEEKIGGTLGVVVDESMLDRLEKQPIELKVYFSGFTTLLLRHSSGREIFENHAEVAAPIVQPANDIANSQPDESASPASPAMADGIGQLPNDLPATNIPPPAPNGQSSINGALPQNKIKFFEPVDAKPGEAYTTPMKITFRDDLKALGMLVQIPNLKIKTEFGEVDLSLANVTGIKFNVDEDPKKIFVILNTRDSLTAQTDLNTLTMNIENQNGQVKLSDLDSVTTTVNVKFVPDAEKKGR